MLIFERNRLSFGNYVSKRANSNTKMRITMFLKRAIECDDLLRSRRSVEVGKHFFAEINVNCIQFSPALNYSKNILGKGHS